MEFKPQVNQNQSQEVSKVLSQTAKNIDSVQSNNQCSEHQKDCDKAYCRAFLNGILPTDADSQFAWLGAKNGVIARQEKIVPQQSAYAVEMFKNQANFTVEIEKVKMDVWKQQMQAHQEMMRMQQEATIAQQPRNNFDWKGLLVAVEVVGGICLLVKSLTTKENRDSSPNVQQQGVSQQWLYMQKLEAVQKEMGSLLKNMQPVTKRKSGKRKNGKSNSLKKRK